MTSIEEQQLARLVASLEHLKIPFDRKQIGKIPASSGRPALDFVGHAIVVQRLNQYAPDWSYTVEETFEANGKFWIRGTMTICAVSRVEYGMGKNPLEAMSHFVRRAAMRFGVATDLWSKEESESWGDAVPAPVPERPEPVAVVGKDTTGSGESSGTPDAGEGHAPSGSMDSSASVPEPHVHEAGPRKLASGKPLCKHCGKAFDYVLEGTA